MLSGDVSPEDSRLRPVEPSWSAVEVAALQRAVDLLQRGADEGEPSFVGEVVLAEVVRVLASRYRCGREEIARVVRQLTEVQDLALESTDRVVRALRAFERGRGGFAECLIAERARDAGCQSVATFDRALHADSGFLAP